MTKPIFVSFASKDRKMASTICSALENHGFECWLSTRDVEAGQNYQEAITRAIRSAKIMLLVFTANANNSDEIKKELALASRAKVLVIPLRVEDVLPSEAFDYEFATRQWIDLFEDWDRAFATLSDQIATIVPPRQRPIHHPEPVVEETASELPNEAEHATATPVREKTSGGHSAHEWGEPVPSFAGANLRSAASALSIDRATLKWLLPLIGAGLVAAVIFGMRSHQAVSDPSIPGQSATTYSPTEANAKGVDAQKRKDFTEAMQWYRAAADKGNADAMTNMGNLYLLGEGVSADAAQAMQWFKRAADLGDARGQASLGRLYEYANGVHQDFAEAMHWYGLAADQPDDAGHFNFGSLSAQVSLGSMYQYGEGAPTNYAEAMRWYRRAADREAAALAAEQRGDASQYVTPPDVYIAMAQNGIGELLNYGGYGVSQNDAEALRWYRMAANHGNSGAQYQLARFYHDGRAVTADNAEAMRWARMSADQGDGNGQWYVGWLYENGAGVTQDYAEALRWYSKSADQGNAYGENAIGTLYYSGNGVTINYATAMEWFRKAADQQNGDAGYNVGLLYNQGLGVTQDVATARSWMEKASSNGSSDAKKWLADNPANP